MKDPNWKGPPVIIFPSGAERPESAAGTVQDESPGFKHFSAPPFRKRAPACEARRQRSRAVVLGFPNSSGSNAGWRWNP